LKPEVDGARDMASGFAVGLAVVCDDKIPVAAVKLIMVMMMNFFMSFLIFLSFLNVFINHLKINLRCQGPGVHCFRKSAAMPFRGLPFPFYKKRYLR
jgi:hypothetical protein